MEFQTEQTESEALQEAHHWGDFDEFNKPEKPELGSNLMYNAIGIYCINKNANVGEEIICPTCGKKFIKTSYQHTFCGLKGKGKKNGKGKLCKDTYHNSVNDSRRMRARIYNKG